MPWKLDFTRAMTPRAVARPNVCAPIILTSKPEDEDGSVDTPLKNPRSGRLIVLAHSNVPSEGKDKKAELGKAE